MKAESHCGLIPPVPRPKGKCLSWRQSPSACLLPPRLSSHELAQHALCSSPLTLPCFPGRRAICAHRSLESALLWAVAGCYQVALIRLKRSSQGLPYRILSAGPYPAPLHLICKKCQAALGTLPGSEPLCRVHFDAPFGHFHRSLEG